jgi:hypothetical protein
MKTIGPAIEGTKLVASSIWESIIEWHKTARQADIKAMFELGDLVLNAVIHTGLKENDVIRRIVDNVGELSYGISTYNRAARCARKFIASQRKVLIAKGVSLNKAEILAGEHYDEGNRRVKVIADIKSGDLTSPWDSIRGVREAKHLRETATLRHGLSHPSDVICIQVRHNGEYDRTLMYDGLRSLVSQPGCKQEHWMEQLNKAIVDRRKAGFELKEVIVKE